MIFRFAFFVSIAFISCNETSDIQKVNMVIYQLIDADNRSDINSVIQAYSDNIEFHPANKPSLKGISDIRSSYEKLFKENRLEIKTEIKETIVNGNEAIVKGVNTGTIKSIQDSGAKKINDYYVAYLSKESNGTWKITRLQWQPNN